MKKFNIITRVAVLIIAVFSLSGCEKNFLDVNENPNLPKDVPVNITLPAAQVSLAYSFGGDVARYCAVFTQNVTGADRQFAGYNTYSFIEEDFNNLWNNMYAGNMEDLKQIMTKADASPGNYDAYNGVAKILMSFSLMTMTDLFGNVPYTKAFQGNANISPAYDTQQEIYMSILPGLLNGAIADFANSSDDFITPGADDLIYGGDLVKWTSFANALKARMAIHLIKIDPNASQAALDALAAGGFTGTGDDAQVPFPGGSNANPWYQYIDQRADISYSSLDDYYGIGNTLTDSMEALGDPRFGAIIDTAGAYYAPGFPSPFYMEDVAPVYLMTYFEQKFIEAEAKLRLGDEVGAEAALHEAITANMMKLGVAASDDSLYQAANVVWTGNATDKLNLILLQKYFANYLQPETFNDWRRTGQPDLQPNDGAIGQIPRRLIYPTNERLYNANEYNQNSTMQTPRLYWDN